MITIHKLSSLKSLTRQRKIISIFKDFELEIKTGIYPEKNYLIQVTELAGNLDTLNENEKKRIKEILMPLRNSDYSALTADEKIRVCNSLRHLLLTNISKEPAEWDLILPMDRDSQNSDRTIMPFRIYLDDIRSPFNVGSIFRTAESFGVEKVYLSRDTASPDHVRAVRSAMGCISRLPREVIDPSSLPDLPVFALELGGTSLDTFDFPDTGILIIGSEELGVCPELLKRADNSLGRVSVPLGGVKGSINVSVAFGIVVQRWFSIIRENKKAVSPVEKGYSL